MYTRIVNAHEPESQNAKRYTVFCGNILYCISSSTIKYYMDCVKTRNQKQCQIYTTQCGVNLRSNVFVASYLAIWTHRKILISGHYASVKCL